MPPQWERYHSIVDPIIRDLMTTREQIDIQDVIDQAQDVIVDAHSRLEITDEWKSAWINFITLRAKVLNATVASKRPTWKAIENRIQTTGSPRTSKPTTPHRSRTSGSMTKKSSSSSNGLRVPLTEEQKKEIPKMLDGLDRNKFWILEATKQQALKDKQQPLSVEEKMKNFAMKCNYVHPCLSLILDVDDGHWASEFSKEELEEIGEYGTPLLRDLPLELKAKLDEIFEQDSALGAYNFGRKIEHNPINEPILAWLSQTLMTTAKFFLTDGAYDTDSFLESDSLYYLWSFYNTVFHGSSVVPIGKEKSSDANAAAQNAKRKLSAIEAVEKKKMGRRMDTIYKASHIELGCLEITQTPDDTKKIADSMLKLAVVMKDMLIEITTQMPTILHDIHILGYNINGKLLEL
ncbi:hypothetical protein BJV82DRAFT_341221 [Fennellomyces sp. T-0311]|nr:hypothetical protein BJV82DRAFT_341221 [Fennellomyces sp. T-0311]